MKVALYNRTTAGDVSRLPDLREYARGRGWEVTREFEDHLGLRLDRHWPQLAELRRLVKGKGVQAVVVAHITHIARSVRNLAVIATEMLAAGVHLVSLDDKLDTSDFANRVRWTDFIETLRRFDLSLRSSTSRVARIRHLKRLGGDNWGRPRAEISLVELAGHYHGSASRRPLSFREMARLLGVCPSTVRSYTEGWVESRDLDPEVRATNLAAAGGHNKGGRPSRAKRFEDAELLALYQGARPQSLKKIAARFRTSRDTIKKHLKRLEEAGLLDPAGRAERIGR